MCFAQHGADEEALLASCQDTLFAWLARAAAAPRAVQLACDFSNCFALCFFNGLFHSFFLQSFCAAGCARPTAACRAILI